MFLFKKMPLLSLGVIYLVTFIVSCLMGANPLEASNVFEQRSVASVILGETQRSISGFFRETADSYFHGGIGHQHEEAFHKHFFQNIFRSIQPAGHVHLEGDDRKETLPLARMATWLDPHDIETYQVMAFQLDQCYQQSDKAHDLLKEAIINNPLNYHLFLEDGLIYFRGGQVAEAETAFRKALALWPSDDGPDSRKAIVGKKNILLHYAAVRYAQDNRLEAIDLLKQMLELGSDSSISRLIEIIKEGKVDWDIAEAIKRRGLEQSRAERSFCAEAEAEERSGHEHDEGCQH